MDKNQINYTAILNRGYYLGKYLDPRLKDAVYKRISELELKSGKSLTWQKYKQGIDIGIQEWKLEQLKRVHNINRSDKTKGLSR